MSADDSWHPSDIPEHKRGHMYVDSDGFLTLKFKPMPWITAGQARASVMQAFGIDAAAASEAIKLRLISGHIVASAGAVFGPMRKRERTKITGGREYLANTLWQYFRLEESLWAVGDLQARVLEGSGGGERTVTYTDVRFLENNVLKMVDGQLSALPVEPIGNVGSDLFSPPPTVKQSSTRPRGRPTGSGAFDVHDAPLLDEMRQLLASGLALSANAAATAVVDRAFGGGSVDSKVKRLRDAFLARERKGV